MSGDVANRNAKASFLIAAKQTSIEQIVQIQHQLTDETHEWELTDVCGFAAGRGAQVEHSLALLRRQGDDGQQTGPALQHVLPRQVLRRRTCTHNKQAHA